MDTLQEEDWLIRGAYWLVRVANAFMRCLFWFMIMVESLSTNREGAVRFTRQSRSRHLALLLARRDSLIEDGRRLKGEGERARKSFMQAIVVHMVAERRRVGKFFWWPRLKDVDVAIRSLGVMHSVLHRNEGQAKLEAYQAILPSIGVDGTWVDTIECRRYLAKLTNEQLAIINLTIVNDE